MSHENQPKFDKDIELAKVNLVADEWRAFLLTNVGIYLSAIIAIDAAIVSGEIARQLPFLGAVLAVAVSGAWLVGMMYLRSLRPYQKRVKDLDVLLGKVYKGESIGDVETLLKK